ncbi:MAG: ABC transporter permease [Verrucomicrobiota bacterium]
MQTPQAEITVERLDGETLEVSLAGSHRFGARLTGEPEVVSALQPPVNRLCMKDHGITDWDSALLNLILRVRKVCEGAGVSLDLSDLPGGVSRLVDLATAVPEREGSRREDRPGSFLSRLGTRATENAAAVKEAVAFLGSSAVSVLRFLFGKARYRKADFWLIVQQCGPQALSIVGIISVLVGAILAFVGAIQLRMFGAEIFVANLVGLGMVIEMGALMTGITLAGRTGAAFAAQLGTMQVNEEIDALQTMGIPPMDYLVMPRMVALAVMTPLLVIFADVLGILGGALVGIFVLELPLSVYFSQTVEFMTVWHCAQGLIKGATFGIIVAVCGCYRGMSSGRSASAVGEAATSAVVTSIIMIVIADAIWTFIFLLGGP